MVEQERIPMRCPNCGKTGRGKASYLGRDMTCPNCKERVRFVRVEPAGEAQPSPPLRPPASERARGEAQRGKPRYWIAVCILALFVLAWFLPYLTLWAGVLVLALVVLSFVPRIRSFPRRLLRLDPAKPVRLGIKVAVFALTGFVLLLFSWAGFEAMEHEANAEVATLVEKAQLALESGDVAAAVETLRAALGTEHATELQAAQGLRRKIARATDPKGIREALIGLNDVAFTEFQKGQSVPREFRFGYAVLDQQAEELARAQVAEVVAAREQCRQQRLADERERQKKAQAAAEAARKAQERRRAEAKRQEEERERRMNPLVVESWNWHVEHGYAIVEGEVTNVSHGRLENVQAVVSFYTEDSQFITSSDAIVEYNPILPGQTTPFKVYATHNPRMKSARLSFTHLFGGTIGYKKR